MAIVCVARAACTGPSARLLPGVLLLLGGHVKAEVKLPAPLGIAGQGRHHPLAGGARRLEQPYCRHTSGQLLGEVTKRRSIHLSSGLTETRHVTRGGCLGLPGLKVCPLPPWATSHPVLLPRAQRPRFELVSWATPPLSLCPPSL